MVLIGNRQVNREV